MSDCEEKMKEHWEFLERFLKDVVYESNHVTFTDKQFEAFEKELNSIEYGFKLAWPHAWKHGAQDLYKKLSLKNENRKGGKK